MHTDGAALDRNTCLHHYTSAVGLEGILRSRSLWATDTDFLNDWQEIHYAAKPLIGSNERTFARTIRPTILVRPMTTDRPRGQCCGGRIIQRPSATAAGCGRQRRW